MISFEQHSDGRVYVRTDAVTYTDTAENFASDYGQAAPALPDGTSQRVYVPGVRHAIGDGSSVIAGGDMPWAFGDQAIAGIASMLEAQASRAAP